jgi:hypothetical protein
MRVTPDWTRVQIAVNLQEGLSIAVEKRSIPEGLILFKESMCLWSVEEDVATVVTTVSNDDRNHDLNLKQPMYGHKDQLVIRANLGLARFTIVWISHYFFAEKLYIDPLFSTVFQMNDLQIRERVYSNKGHFDS